MDKASLSQGVDTGSNPAEGVYDLKQETRGLVWGHFYNKIKNTWNIYLFSYTYYCEREVSIKSYELKGQRNLALLFFQKLHRAKPLIPSQSKK